jgi:hypothetical protein
MEQYNNYFEPWRDNIIFVYRGPRSSTRIRRVHTRRMPPANR